MKRWKKWELALLLGLCAALIWGAWSAQRQDALARKMIRLHVIANSDSAEDQALKLEVRDKVLNFTTNVLQRSVDMEDAQMQLQDALDRIENIAQREIVNQGYDYPVTAQLTRTEFPLKEYDGFSLPAGEYMALRLVIGEGAGQNWWCVVFPPLCLGSVTETVEETACTGGFTRSEVALITGETEGYVVKFKAMELWDEFKEWTGRW